MKLYWTGTDSLMLVDYSMRKRIKRVYWWCFRRYVRVSEVFIQSHAVTSWNLADNLHKFGVRKPVGLIPSVYDQTKYDKVDHAGFNVLFYFPKGGDRKFKEWLYGYDIYLKIKDIISWVNFIEVDGTYDMSTIYPITDFLLRCNRHDGCGRMALECAVNDIPYYHSQKDPNFNDIYEAIIKATKKH